jgi:hypothetical protein
VLAAARLVALRRGKQAGQLDLRGGDLGADRLELVERPVAGMAPEDRVRVAKHAEERAPAAAVLAPLLDQPGISTSCTSTPPMRVVAATGRVVVKA